MKLLKILIGVFVLLCIGINPISACIIINEAMIDPTRVYDTYGEWLELYNTGDSDIDINGWIIKDADLDYHQIDNGGSLVISAKGYLVLGRNGDPSQNGGYIPDYVYDSFQLANTEDEILLLTSGESGVSEIDYNDSSWPIYPGRSMAYSGSGDINNPANWFATPEESVYVYGDGDYGTPGAANVIPEPATIILLTNGLLSYFFLRKNK